MPPGRQSCQGPHQKIPNLSAMSEDRSRFDATKLVAARKARGFSQRELASKAGVSQALVAELEREKHPPSRASLDKILAALDLPSSALG